MTGILKHTEKKVHWQERIIRGGSRTAAISKMERFVIIVNSWKPLTITTKPLTIITKCSILDVAVALGPPLIKFL